MSKFLESALSKNKSRPELCILHGNMATDGNRLHRDNSLPAVEDDLTQAIARCGLIPTEPRNRATVSRLDLMAACKRAMAFRDEWDRSHGNYPIMSFCMNGKLIYSACNEELGKTYGEITDGEPVTDKYTSTKKGLKIYSHKMIFQHHGEKTVSFAMNPRQLLDALEGMEGETVEIDIPHPDASFYVTDGTREAVIMPIKLAVK